MELLVTFSKSHSGPLPAPETFAEYDRTLPGAAERILAMAEKEQDHRHKMDGRVVTHEYGGRYVGQAGAFLALLVLLGAVCFCAYVGQPLAAAVITAVGAIVIGFLRYSSLPKESARPEPAQKQTKRRKR